MAKTVIITPTSNADPILSFEQDNSSENENLSTMSENLLSSLLIECHHAFLELQLKSHAAISDLIPDFIDDFNQALEQKRAEWHNFIVEQNNLTLSAEDLIIFWQQGLKICKKLWSLELENLRINDEIRFVSYDQYPKIIINSNFSIDNLSGRTKYLRLLKHLELAKKSLRDAQDLTFTDIQELSQSIKNLQHGSWHFGRHSDEEFNHMQQFYFDKFEQLLYCYNLPLNQEIYNLLKSQITELVKYNKNPSIIEICRTHSDLECA